MLADDETPEATPQVKGGIARRDALEPAERSEIARNAANARWTTPRATHAGPLTIGSIKIPCAVLDDGTRVLSRVGFLRAIGRTGKAKGGRKYDQEFQLPVFLTAENLKPFISSELLQNSNPIPYRTLSGTSALGYRADLLPWVCAVFLDAKEAGALRANQLRIAETCKILSRGFSVVGLTALIDEATGYQEVRDRQALQAILDAYLRKEFAAWAKRFPDEFYQEIFRLRKWKWRGMKVNRPQVVAHYTNDLVYARLETGILRELRKRNPKDERGVRLAAHHQWLTENIGHPRLQEHLYGVIGLMRASDSWDAFMQMMNRAYPKKKDQLELALINPENGTNAP